MPAIAADTAAPRDAPAAVAAPPAIPAIAADTTAAAPLLDAASPRPAPWAVAAPPTASPFFGWATRQGLRDDLDLILVAVLAIVAVLLVTIAAPMAVRLPIGLAMTLGLPGYATTIALAPTWRLSPVERAVVAFGLSLAVLLVAAPVIDAAPGPLVPEDLVGFTAGYTLMAAGTAVLRRRRARAVSIGSQQPTEALPGQRLTRTSVAWGAALLVAIAAVAGIAGLVSAPPAASEFFIRVGAGSLPPSGIPATVGVPTTVHLGLTNRAGATETYRVVARSGTTDLGSGEPFSVGAGATWTGAVPITFSNQRGGVDVEILLYRADSPEVYRSLRVRFEVGPAAAYAAAFRTP